MVHIPAIVMAGWIVYTSYFGTGFGASEVAIGVFLGAYVFGMSYLLRS